MDAHVPTVVEIIFVANHPWILQALLRCSTA